MKTTKKDFMSLRWRKNGQLLCGAKSKEEQDDVYIGDRLHYQLSVVERCIVPSEDESVTGIWVWKNESTLNLIRNIKLQKTEFSIYGGGKDKVNDYAYENYEFQFELIKRNLIKKIKELTQ